MGSRLTVSASLVALSSTGCFLSGLLPDTRTAVDRARDVAPKCAAFSEDVVRPTLAPSFIETVEPDYAFVSSGSADREARLLGVRIHMGPRPGMSRETLERGLRCHQARVVLGETAASNRDPYSMDGLWLDIGADSDGDGFVVSVRTTAVRDARILLGRARSLVVRSE
jgi:hypothetical protein